MSHLTTCFAKLILLNPQIHFMMATTKMHPSQTQLYPFSSPNGEGAEGG